MKSFFAPLAVVATLAAAVSAQTFTINSLSNVVVCQPTLITWTGGQAPYFLSILPAGQPDATALVDLGQQNGNSVTWLANLAVGVSGFLDLRDNTGALAQSGSFTINPGSNTTCVGQPISQSAGAPVATTGGAATSAPASPASTTPSSGGATTSPSSGSTAGSSSASTKTTGTTTGATTKPTSGAISKYATAGAAVMLGSVVLGLAL